MFKNKDRFVKFLKIAMPILFGANVLLVIAKILYFLLMDGDYAFKMFAVTTLYSVGNYYPLYSFSGLVLVGNLAVSVLAFIALTLLKIDEKFRIITLVGGIVSLVMFVALSVLGFGLDLSLVSYWIIPVWFVVASYHIALAVIYFVIMLSYKKGQEQPKEEVVEPKE